MYVDTTNYLFTLAVFLISMAVIAGAFATYLAIFGMTAT